MTEALQTLLDQYDFDLPEEQIAQHPAPAREDARLLCVDRAAGALRHSAMRDFARELRPEDLLVRNATRVVPARLYGRKESGGRAEALVLGAVAGASHRWRALLSTRGRQRVGLRLVFGPSVSAEVVAVADDGEVELHFHGLAPGATPYTLGTTPLPPYIRDGHAEASDAERYQTLYARVPGSVAAPTAGLHFGERLIADLAARGVEQAEVILHVGAGTFRPLRPEQLDTGTLHEEPFELPEETAEAVARTRARGGRVMAVGTTTTRVLETCAEAGGLVHAATGTTQLFLRPPQKLRVVDGLLTNFHLPRSSLLLLVAAFAGRELTLRAYREAVRAGYRFFSYGDAMWLS